MCGPTVACTITVHHLALTVDSWAGQPLNFCKPVAKLASDREALRTVVASGDPKFFLGSDSAPHSLRKKMPSAHDFVHKQLLSSSNQSEHSECPTCAAGIYSSSEILPLLADIFEDEKMTPRIPLERLEGFASKFGREFYKEPIQAGEKDVILERVKQKRPIPAAYPFTSEDGEQELIRPLYAGKEISWQIRK